MTSTNSNEHRAAKRSLDLIEQIAIAGEPLSLAELTRRMQLPKSSTYALVRTLTTEGYLARGIESGHYSLGPRLLRIVSGLADQFELGRVAEGFMQQLADDFPETVLLGVRRGRSVFYIHSIESPQALRYAPAIGEPRPLHCTSIGKLFLADLKPTELVKLVGTLDLATHTSRTIVDVPKLLAEIEAVRELGFSTNQEESVTGAIAVAAPIYERADSSGRLVAGVSLAGPADRMRPELETATRRVIETAHQIGLHARA